jgi:hypothetical protein
MSFAPVEAQQRAKSLLQNILLLPRLKAFVHHTAGNTKQDALHRFPLAAGPQDEQQIIHDRSIGLPAASRF